MLREAKKGGSCEPPFFLAAFFLVASVHAIRTLNLYDLVVDAKQQKWGDPVADKQTRILLPHNPQHRGSSDGA
jgi:hypothetical protein